jgi:hypothetical protein
MAPAKSFHPIKRAMRRVADWWLVIRPARFALIILLVGVLALTGVEPAHDVFNGIATDYQDVPNTYWALLAGVALWSLSILLTVYLAYEYADLKPRRKSVYPSVYSNDWFATIGRFMPRVLSCLPFAIAASGFWAADVKLLRAYPWGILLTGGIWLAVAPRIERLLKFTPRRVSLEPLRFNKWLLLGVLGVFFSFFLLSFSIDVALFMASVAVILVGLSAWTVLGMFASILRYRYRFPATEAILVWVVFCAFFNNNHTVVSVDENLPPLRVADTLYFRQWVTQLVIDTKAKGDTNTIPVYIVAGEGGGIRAAQWTLGILAGLDSAAARRKTSFYRNVFAFTGVSGSSVGFAFYQGLRQLRDRNHKPIPVDSLPFWADTLVANDFLSPVTAGLVFPDMVQRFLPVPMPPFSRARFLEKGFAYHFEQTTETIGDTAKNGQLTRTFRQICPARLDSAITPCFFFNTTHVETGRKGILSNVALTDAYFYDALDVFKHTKHDFSLITTAAVSARFPLVTPPACIKFYYPEADCTVANHFVDGGYFENTGLHTAFEVLRLINDGLQKMDSTLRQRIRPTIVFLKNGSTDLNDEKLGWKYETAPLRAFVGAWDRRSVSQAYDMEKIVAKMGNGARMVTFALTRDRVPLPTTWYIAPRGREAIRQSIGKELSQIEINKKGLFATSKSADSQ